MPAASDGATDGEGSRRERRLAADSAALGAVKAQVAAVTASVVAAAAAGTEPPPPPPVFGYTTAPGFAEIPFPDFSYWGHEMDRLTGAPSFPAAPCLSRHMGASTSPVLRLTFYCLVCSERGA